MVNEPAMTEFHRPVSGIPDRPKVPAEPPKPAKLVKLDREREL
jgi:hypothetical protein